jgi:SAM-dependent methyltransferase
LDNASPQGTHHLDGLTGMFDRFTAARIEETTRLEGARCLELGAGNGSVARWLAGRVGPEGHVLATDIEPKHIPEHDRLTVLQHDLLVEPMPAGPFDLIHGRLIFGHLTNSDALLSQACKLLAPGGTLLIEDFNIVDDRRSSPVLHTPADQPELRDLWVRFEKARGEAFIERGADGRFALRAHGLMIGAGLLDVTTVTYCQSWRGGDPGSRHAGATMKQLLPRLAEHGWTQSELDQLVAAVDNPEFQVTGRPLASISGQAPG